MGTSVDRKDAFLEALKDAFLDAMIEISSTPEGSGREKKAIDLMLLLLDALGFEAGAAVFKLMQK